MLFTHITMWYGNQDVIARMVKDMLPVCHADYATQQADKAKRLANEVIIDAWDLTGFLLPEVAAAESEKLGEVKIELLDEKHSKAKERCDSPVEDRSPKRKRTGLYKS
jgi:hypothetical protein